MLIFVQTECAADALGDEVARVNPAVDGHRVHIVKCSDFLDRKIFGRREWMLNSFCHKGSAPAPNDTRVFFSNVEQKTVIIYRA
jgi:hypothetical protein